VIKIRAQLNSKLDRLFNTLPYTHNLHLNASIRILAIDNTRFDLHLRAGPALGFWRPCANLFMGPSLLEFGFRLSLALSNGGTLSWIHPDIHIGEALRATSLFVIWNWLCNAFEAFRGRTRPLWNFKLWQIDLVNVGSILPTTRTDLN